MLLVYNYLNFLKDFLSETNSQKKEVNFPKGLHDVYICISKHRDTILS